MVRSEPTGSAALSSPVIQMIWGFMASQAVHVAARLAIFDVLRDGPKTAREVAAASESQERPLLRLLRFLTAVDVLTEDAQGRFSATAQGEFLRSDHPLSLRPMALMYGAPFFWRSWGDLYGTVKDGRPAFDHVHGEPFFDYLGRHPEDASIFNTAMTAFSTIDVPAVLAAYDFSGFTRIVDVAGGHGALLRGILERCPAARGVLCDLPSVIANASETERCERVGTNFFESVPAGGDAYILKKILHDWNDDEAVRILENCRRAIAAAGKVLVMEHVVEPPNRPDLAKWMDLNMLVLLTGRERTEAEFGELYARAGFRLTRVIPAGRLFIVEGAAV